MGIANTVAPKTNQQNYDDYISGPRTVTITSTKEVGGEQPYEMHLAEFPGKPYKPSKGMRRVILKAWGDDGDNPQAFAGRRMTLYGDPDVTNMGEVVGGIRISHMSHIPSKLVFSITKAKGKRAPFVVQPLADEPAVPSASDDITRALNAIDTATDASKLDAIEKHAQSLGIDTTPEIRDALITKRGELEGLI